MPADPLETSVACQDCESANARHQIPRPRRTLRLHQPRTATAMIYRWAHSYVAEMVCSRPDTAVDFLQADLATRHFIALVIRGWELHGSRSKPALRQLAEDIFSRPRREILTEQWQCDFGRLTFLRRLPGRVLTRRQYDRLATIIGDPATRSLIAKCAKVTVQEIDAIEAGNLPLIAHASLRAVATIGAPTLGYILAALRRHRPDLGDADLRALLRQIGEAKRVGSWLSNILMRSALPPPPWEGTAAITPLRTIAEIRDAGSQLQNCLGEPDQWLPALLGHCCYYLVREPRGPGIIGLVFDNLIGAWRINSYAGPRNSRLRPTAKRRIFAEFAAAGIQFYGDEPRRRALNWWGIGYELPTLGW